VDLFTSRNECVRADDGPESPHGLSQRVAGSGLRSVSPQQGAEEYARSRSAPFDAEVDEESEILLAQSGLRGGIAVAERNPS
jgi:hypothetical protein